MSNPAVDTAEGHDPSVFTYTGSAEIARDFDRYHQYSLLFKTDWGFLDEVIESGARVLDIGCGTGRLVLPLARKGCEVTGVDLSPHMLREAAKKLDREGFTARLVQADMCRLDGLADSSFDAAACMFSTMGILRGQRLRLRALAEWRRVLAPPRGGAPGGLLVVHTHNLWHNLKYRDGRWWALGNLLASVLPGREFGDKRMAGYCGLEYLYVHIFRLGELRGLLRRAGFRVERELLLNEERTGPIDGRFRRLRANGFIIAARKV